MEGSSKWVRWYRILAVIGCAVIAISSITLGWKASSYFSYHREEHNMAVFLAYAGIGCVIAAAELLLSMMVCEFLDNVSFIAHKLSDWDYSKAAKQFVEELARDSKATELGGSASKAEQSAAKKEPRAPEAEKRPPVVIQPQTPGTQSTNKDHAPVAPVSIEQDKVVCPLCNTVQRANRRLCLNCSVPFITGE